MKIANGKVVERTGGFCVPAAAIALKGDKIADAGPIPMGKV